MWLTVQEFLLRSFQLSLWKMIAALLGTAVMSSALTALVQHLSSPTPVLYRKVYCTPDPATQERRRKYLNNWKSVPTNDGQRF
jgi:hypothetical protein